MKVDAWFLLRNREAKRKKTKAAKKSIDLNGGIYLMNRDSINFYHTGDKPKGVEIFFYEGNPGPIRIDKAGKDTSVDFLNQFIYENVIEQTGEIPKERFRGAFNWVRGNITIGSIVKWVLVLMIIGALVRGALFG